MNKGMGTVYDTYLTYRADPETANEFARAILASMTEAEREASGERVAAMLRRLLILPPPLTEAALTRYMQKWAKGGVLEWIDKHRFGPSLRTRRNRLKRGADEYRPGEPRRRIPWPTDREVNTKYDAGDGLRPRPEKIPGWLHAREGGYRRVVDWVAAVAPCIAFGWGLLAVNQVLWGRTDRDMGRMTNMDHGCWGRIRRRELAALGPMLVEAMPLEILEIISDSRRRGR